MSTPNTFKSKWFVSENVGSVQFYTKLNDNFKTSICLRFLMGLYRRTPCKTQEFRSSVSQFRLLELGADDSNERLHIYYIFAHTNAR